MSKKLETVKLEEDITYKEKTLVPVKLEIVEEQDSGDILPERESLDGSE